MIVDISNPSSPQKANDKNIISADDAGAIAVSDGRLYVWGEWDAEGKGIDGILVVDVSKPSDAKVIGVYKNKSAAKIIAEGDTLYLVGGYFGFQIADVSDAPVITSMSRKRGTVDNKVKIKEKHFGRQEGKVIIKNGDETECQITSWGNRKIKAILPWGVEPGKTKLYVKNSNGKDSKKKKVFYFKKAMPKISALTPKKLTAGESFTLKGINFGPQESDTEKIIVKGGTATVESWGKKTISIKVDEATNKKLTIRVKTMYGKSNKKYISLKQ